MIVQVQQGQLKGTESRAFLSGKVYYSFLGIPFAEAPIGDLRFQPPQLPKKWEGVRNTEKAGADCFQIDIMSLHHGSGPKFKGSEDCLYLNVYVPELPSRVKSPKPVMVFLHGGAYQCGSGAPDYHSPDFLIDYDVIVVTVNYRLNIFGFLNLGTRSCPGNVGLKDQVMALRWIKENIYNFGGDVENITLFGNSAGAASALLHTLSPLSKGLFNRIILLSPVMYLPGEKHDPVQLGFELGRVLGFEKTNVDELVAFLKTKSPEDLLAATNVIRGSLKAKFPGSCVTGILFTPTVELIKENAFLPDSAINLAKDAEVVPCLVGMNNIEGTLGAFILQPEAMQTFSDDFTCFVKSNFKCQSGKLEEAASRIKEFYFGDKTIGPETMNEYLALLTDYFFLNFYKIFDHILRSDSSVYVYFFTFDGRFNATKRLRALASSIKGAGHGDEILYIFYRPTLFAQTPIADAEKTVIKNLCYRLTNFARNGNPNTSSQNAYDEWKCCTLDQPCYLQIDEALQLRPGKILEERRAFWESVAHLFVDDVDL